MELKTILIGAAIATATFEGAAMAAPSQEKSASELGLSEQEYQEFLKSLDSIHETTLSDGDLVAWSIGNYKCGDKLQDNLEILS